LVVVDIQGVNDFYTDPQVKKKKNKKKTRTKNNIEKERNKLQ